MNKEIKDITSVLFDLLEANNISIDLYQNFLKEEQSKKLGLNKTYKNTKALLKDYPQFFYKPEDKHHASYSFKELNLKTLKILFGSETVDEFTADEYREVPYQYVSNTLYASKYFSVTLYGQGYGDVKVICCELDPTVPALVNAYPGEFFNSTKAVGKRLKKDKKI